MRVVVAPDSFKGTCTARNAARAIGDGWLSVRRNDDLVLIPLADGGEGTLDALESVHGAERCTAEVTGPNGRPVSADWLRLPSGEAVIELAQACGLPLMDPLDPLNATTRGVGELIRIALEAGVTSITVALGGSATTDGGAGALAALGARFFDDAGLPLPEGGGALQRLAWFDDHDLIPPPVGGVRLLTDVTNPLLGPGGAAAIFGPQKGATPHQVDELEAGLGRLVQVLGADPAVAGMGAAGGTAYGLATLWGATVVPGAAEVASLSGLVAELGTAEVVITGEGCFDTTSQGGKVVGNVLAEAKDKTIVIAGSVATDCPVASISLERLAGSSAAARTDAEHWLSVAGAAAATHFSPRQP
ncbi:glycerate kinase [Tessaracoccus antarcticus]|uniref:Glycerate kinase n=1 Tax=Tessaracoccus antarcticus TaxID=2479848 RepID=A0A3M0G4U0_9ACTN|nr:glycerate kinase [Tessaracoccus antarcticus]RMB59854.1 glycerate kinase [Tessaracoccus antarcticus]